jgi:hypothetical protein
MDGSRWALLSSMQRWILAWLSLITEYPRNSFCEPDQQLLLGPTLVAMGKSPLSETSDYNDEVKKLKDVNVFQGRIFRVLPANEQGPVAKVERLTIVKTVQKDIINALSTNKQNPVAEVKRLTEVDTLQKKILELLPEHEQDLETEVNRLKSSDKTLNQIEDTLKLDSNLDLITEIEKHQLA